MKNPTRQPLLQTSMTIIQNNNLEIEAELHVVGEQLVGRALVPVQEDVLVVTETER